MTGTRLRWVTRTITAVALFGAATMAPASVSSAWAAEPKLTIDDVRVTEGNTGTWDLVFTVKLSASSSRQVTAAYATGGGSATATTDYTPKQGTVTIAAGQRSATIRVPVVGDTAHEPDETVEVRLSNPVRATIADGLGIGTIGNDDAAPPVLTVTTAGNGVGRVVSQPSGIDCPDDCRESYSLGATVTLNAYAAATDTFTGWTGACSGTGPCTITMNADKSVGANFTDPTPDTSVLHVWIDGWGSGTITSSPAGINCHVQYSGNPYEDDFTGSMTGPCEASFTVGSQVTLTATADPGSHLNSMDCGTYANPCTKTVTSGYNGVYASFCPDNNGLCFPY